MTSGLLGACRELREESRGWPERHMWDAPRPWLNWSRPGRRRDWIRVLLLRPVVGGGFTLHSRSRLARLQKLRRQGVGRKKSLDDGALVELLGGLAMREVLIRGD